MQMINTWINYIYASICINVLPFVTLFPEDFYTNCSMVKLLYFREKISHLTPMEWLRKKVFFLQLQNKTSQGSTEPRRGFSPAKLFIWSQTLEIESEIWNRIYQTCSSCHCDIKRLRTPSLCREPWPVLPQSLIHLLTDSLFKEDTQRWTPSVIPTMKI